MLIVHHIWSRWTKAARGADAPLRRPRLDEAYPLPAALETGAVLRHEIRALEEEAFAVRERAGPVSRQDWLGWAAGEPYRPPVLDWRLRSGAAEIRLKHPSEPRLQTKWPTFLPSPLFALRPGETAKIDWNGRFRKSTSGSNRSSCFEQHSYWLALADAPETRLFLDAQPRKHIDLRTEIY